MKTKKTKSKMAIFLIIVALVLPGIACGDPGVEFANNGLRDKQSSTITGRPGDAMGLASRIWDLQKDNDQK